MTSYKDSLDRFSISYPTNWTVTPATNRFQAVVVQFREPTTGASLNMGIPSFSGITDPEVAINQLVNAIGYGHSLFQNTECTKYKIDGQKACDYITTTDADSLTGTPAYAQMQLASYVNGKLYLFTSTASQDTFDSYIPTFEKMMASFRSPR